MTTIHYEADADLGVLAGQDVAVVHANQAIADFETDLRRRLGERVTPTGPARAER